MFSQNPTDPAFKNFGLASTLEGMSSKAEILANIRKQIVPAVELPEHAGPWIAFENPEEKFCEVLAAVGGEAIILDDPAELSDTVRRLKCMADAQQIVSGVDGVRELGNCDLEKLADPHAVDLVDVAILPGEFAVAENGAIWVDGRRVKHRAVYFLTQHLVLVVARQSMVHNMHSAYQRLANREHGFGEREYGLFISGPSKTADIEQSLVIGAHGPRSMTAILV